MARAGKSKTVNALRDGRLLMVTLSPDGAVYALDNGIGVSLKAGQELARQGDLLKPSIPDIIPNNDGLFPGFSQTWRAK